MRSQVLAWSGLCCALFCYSAGSAYANPGKQLSPTADTTVPVVIKPAAADTSNKPKQDTVKPLQDTTTRPKADTTAKTKADTAARPKEDTALILPPDETKAKSEVGKFTINGLVKDDKGNPIPGAIIRNKTAKLNAQSGPDGKFTIKAGLKDTLLITSVTFADQTIPIEKREPLAVTLTPANANKKVLGEVVVTALGIKKNPRSVGYALSEVSGNAVQEAKEVNFVNALTGKIPGVQISTNTGSMGGSSKITIRGVKSILGDNNAFFVLDGVPMMNSNSNQGGQLNGGGGYDYGSPLQDINPEDIENISVLKGAAATALYGSRGAGGVLLITTKKRPDSEKGIGVTYSLNAQVDQVAILPKYQNLYGGGSNGKFDTLYYKKNPQGFLNEQSATYDDNDGKGRYDLMPQYSSDESWGPRLDGRMVRHYWSWDKNKNNPYFGQTAPWEANPNNVKDFYRTGFTLTNNISMAGNNEKGGFRLSYGNMNQTFVLPNASMNRNNLSFNGNYELTKGVRGVASVNYSAIKAKARPGTGFTGPNPTLQFTMFGQRQLDLDMQKRYQYDDGSQITWNRKSWDNPTVSSSNGPYYNRYRDYETDSRNRLFGYAGVDVDATKWLSFTGRVFMDDYNSLEEERTAKGYTQSGYIKRVRTSREMNYQITADIKKDLSNELQLNATLGGNLMHRQWTVTGGSTQGGLITDNVYNLNNSISPASVIDELYEKQINSVFATANLGYKNMLFLDLTARSDWSSALSKGYNQYFYPSASASFVFSDLLKDWKWLSFGKLRGSMAAVGNDTDPYHTYRVYDFVQPFNNNPISQYPVTKNIPDLKPERTTEFETGVELKFLDNRVGVDFTYYNRTSKNQIITLPIPGATGYLSTYANAGSVSNKGFEIGLNLNPIRLKNGFRWDINANISRNRNKLLDMDVLQYNTSLPLLTIGSDRRTQKVSVVAKVGEPLGTIMGTDYRYDANGNKLVGANGYYLASAIKPIGNAYPDYVGGITNTFSFKGIYVSALIDFQHGGNFFSYTNLYGEKSGLLESTVENNIRENGIVVPGVTEDGRPNTKVISAKEHFNVNGGNVISKANLYDASYIYLREAKIGYNLPYAWYKKVGAQSARISLYGRNLWLIKSNAPNVDPSNILNSASNIQGIEGGALPSLRSFGINLNVSF
ncbi:SusC/RagA family TonB-linked outer membrane protein [Chitinophaga nivalis]|uniref:SusC/RagA family TonB-linked outer membrane protein n=1 Tax=Chitinophaga nivalis TaxID=2991709 RepID=A0ABT3IU87_9BACT|nr:SusC/RagA family TonB-linked outer membrane protein [Chitinophaga nivalis]MCW3462811.1 SusC/RagA family TonB-linked outer membrane protein [Chitinophaga nivalis]MCW3487499.1 SusC/RagA family TonB-linked outer membrane protein [Chitinophaga nivalis]